jgi:hypothetical protein
MLNIRAQFALILTLFIASGACAENKNYPPKTPWHLADIWWTATSEAEDFTELSIDFEIIGELGDDVLLYIAPMGLGQLNGTSFYGGIQTDAGGWKTKESRKNIKFGKGGIFSRWSKDDKPISLDYADGDANTHYESAGYEGHFASVRTKFHWSEGKYKYSVRKLKTTEENGADFSWFGAYVYDYKSDKEHYIGALKFAGSKCQLGKKHAAFVEVYGGSVKSEIPQITVIFNEPKVNGQRRVLASTAINYPNNNYESKDLPRYAYSQVGNHKVVVMTIPSGLKDGKTREKY